METKFEVLGHPVHPLLVVFPLGLLSTAVIFDILFVLGLLGAGIALFTAWLGGELVYRLDAGVDDQAGLNAPNSLSIRIAGVDRPA